MTLADCTPGDWVVVADADGERVVEFGARLGAYTVMVGRKKEKHHRYALVTPLDRDTFAMRVRGAEMMGLDAEVVDVVATASWRRAALARVRCVAFVPSVTENGDVDPMSMRRGGTF